MINSNDTIRNRTSDLPACSAVPQPTAPPRTPLRYNTHVHLGQETFLSHIGGRHLALSSKWNSSVPLYWQLPTSLNRRPFQLETPLLFVVCMTVWTFILEINCSSLGMASNVTLGFSLNMLYFWWVKIIYIPMKLERLIKMCLNETHSRVRVCQNLCDMFPMKNGLNKEMLYRHFFSTCL